MALSAGFRRAMKNRTRRSRRLEVLVFFVLITCGLSFAGQPFRWGQLGARALPLIYAAGRIYRLWNWQKMIPVSSLDDRAMMEHGVEFNKLTDEQQEEILRRYRVGTYLLNYFPDEFEVSREAKAHVRAYEVMKVLLPSFAVVYWAGWHLLPEGRVRAGWTDGPLVLTWVLLFVLALPQMIRMWTEPDEVGEPKVMAMEREG
jgi:hypothetical protein